MKWSLLQTTRVYWQIQTEWNKSKTQEVKMTVEQALRGLRTIYEMYPHTSVGKRASELTEQIVRKQTDRVDTIKSPLQEPSGTLYN